jgi:hypothetical protein
VALATGVPRLEAALPARSACYNSAGYNLAWYKEEVALFCGISKRPR